MSDSTSASIFSGLFVYLADKLKKYPEREKELCADAEILAGMHCGLDFHECDMGVDEELALLGQAKMVLMSEHPDEGISGDAEHCEEGATAAIYKREYPEMFE